MKYVIFSLLCLTFSKSEAKNKIIYIHKDYIYCDTITDQQCIQYREEGSPMWKKLVGDIVGFKFDSYLSYRLEVKDYGISDANAKRTSKRFKLVKVLQSASENIVDVPKNLIGVWDILTIHRDPTVFNNPQREIAPQKAFIIIAADPSESTGFLACENYTFNIACTEHNGIEMCLSHKDKEKCNETSRNLEMELYDLLSGTFTYELVENRLTLKSTERKSIAFQLVKR